MKALIVDDEPLPAKHLADLVAQHCFEITSVSTFRIASKAIAHLQNHHYDILFLDIQLPEMDGFDFLEHAQLPPTTAVIFVTAYSQYAIAAFKANATHYILKPVEPDELIQAVRKATRELRLVERETLGANPNPHQTLSVYDGTKYHILNQNDVVCLESEGSYTRIYSTTHKPLLSSKRLGSIMERLDPTRFFRCHNSHVVNVQMIVNVSKGKSGYITLSNEQVIPVAAAKKGQLGRRLGM